MKVTTDSCFLGAWAAEKMKNGEFQRTSLLDIGAGTGLLSLMIAQKNTVEIDAVEIDNEAAQQAKENVEATPWKNNVHIINENILSFHPQKKYDSIISNPPFYENELTSLESKKNIAHHSEQLTISQVAQIIKSHLKENGAFFLMYPFKRKEEVERLLQQNGLYIESQVILSQSVRHAPFRVVVKGVNKKTSLREFVYISIWNEHQQYTQSFVDLLKDYYLYL